MSAGGFEVSVFGFRVVLLTESRTARAFFDRHLLPWLPRSAPEPEAELTFRISRNKEGQGFDAYAGGELIAWNDQLHIIFTMFQNLIDQRVVRSRSDIVPVHAGAVAHNGRAVVLPASSQAGKTTLVMELLKAGAVYYSDEYALINGDGWVQAYPRALMPRASDGWQRPTLASEWNAPTADSPALVRLIVSVEFVSGAEWKVSRLPQSEALLLLLRNTPEEMAVSPDISKRLLPAVSSAACYTGVRGEAAVAAAHVMELLADLG